MISDVLGVLLNIPLTWMLLFGKGGFPELGIAGAALATVVAPVFSVGLFLYFYFSRSHRNQFNVMASFHIDKAILRRYLRLGTPSGLESFMNTATFNLFLLMFQSYGIVQGASMAIVFNWDMLSFVPMIGLNIGVMSLIGRFVGAGDTRWLMTTSISIHMLMLVAQYFIIMVYDFGPLVSWWCFVAMLISLAIIYLRRLMGGVWRRPERLARVMAE